MKVLSAKFCTIPFCIEVPGGPVKFTLKKNPVWLSIRDRRDFYWGEALDVSAGATPDHCVRGQKKMSSGVAEISL
jgi:hypothetical protein